MHNWRWTCLSFDHAQLLRPNTCCSDLAHGVTIGPMVQPTLHINDFVDHVDSTFLNSGLCPLLVKARELVESILVQERVILRQSQVRVDWLVELAMTLDLVCHEVHLVKVEVDVSPVRSRNHA